MRQELEKAIGFALTREKEAEAFYKDWAQRASDPAVRLLFAELGAREHGHWQMLAHITPGDLTAHPQCATHLGIAEWLVDIKAHAGVTLQDGLAVAMEQEGAAARLYDKLAELGGESAPLFRAMASEEREHRRRIEAIRGRNASPQA